MDKSLRDLRPTGRNARSNEDKRGVFTICAMHGMILEKESKLVSFVFKYIYFK